MVILLILFAVAVALFLVVRPDQEPADVAADEPRATSRTFGPQVPCSGGTVASGLIRVSSPIKPVRALLSDECSAERTSAPTQSEIDAPAEVVALIGQLQHDMPAVVGAAARNLGRIGHPAAVQPLIDALRHPSRPASLAAAEALLELGPRTTEPLRDALQAENAEWVRMVMVALLAHAEANDESSLQAARLAIDELPSDAAEQLAGCLGHYT